MQELQAPFPSSSPAQQYAAERADYRAAGMAARTDLGAEAGDAAESSEAAELPPPPKSVRDTGLPQQLIVELIAKTIFIGGKTHLPVLTTRLHLSINVLREVLDFMVAEQLAEVAWRGASDIDVQYQLTTAGKQRAGAWLERSPYVGPAPVTLEAYRARVERQAGPGQVLGADELAAELADDFLAPAQQRMLGAAMHAGRALLLYGPPGGGKSTLARKLGALQQGLVAVPHALLAGQEIIQVHDAAVHLPPAARQARAQPDRRGGDSRWILCQRPLLALGADLNAETLAPQADPHGGCYQAPPQLKANNGMLIIDDLGCQRAPAAELLNRFLQAQERGASQLALAGGYKFSVPCRQRLVFATSLAPQSLFDPSTLRRLGYKVPVGALSQANFRTLFRRQCLGAGVAFDEAALRYLLDELYAGSGQALLASYPREIIDRIVDFAAYAGEAPRLTPAALDQAWLSMFAGCDPLPSAIAQGQDQDPLGPRI